VSGQSSSRAPTRPELSTHARRVGARNRLVPPDRGSGRRARPNHVGTLGRVCIRPISPRMRTICPPSYGPGTCAKSSLRPVRRTYRC